MPSASSEYQPFRRPQTPEHARPYDPRGSAAASPQGAYSTTPEMQRYGTPQQGYHHRGPSHDGRDPNRMPPGPPPRPTSQPKSFANMPPRSVDMGRGGPEEMYPRREEMPRGSMEENVERKSSLGKGKEESAHILEVKDREVTRLIKVTTVHPRSKEVSHLRSVALRSIESRVLGLPASNSLSLSLSRSRSRLTSLVFRTILLGCTRDIMTFLRRRVRTIQAKVIPRRRLSTSNLLRMTGTLRPTIPNILRTNLGSTNLLSSRSFNIISTTTTTTTTTTTSSNSHNRSTLLSDSASIISIPKLTRPNLLVGQRRMDRHHPLSLTTMAHQCSIHLSLLAVQEINRKGRVSPLPQAVQGAQPQLPGPAGEPGIKSEFGRMFSGIGSGVGMGVSSPVTTGAQLPYTNASLARRDDDSVAHDSGPDAAPKPDKKGRRRKLKDEDNKVEEESNGTATSAARGAKRPKTVPHHHHHHKGHHHHHRHPAKQSATPVPIGITPFKNIQGTTPLPSPTVAVKDMPAAHHHHVPRTMHHHHHTHVKEAPARPAVPSPTAVIPPKPKTIVRSQSVFDVVADRPRTHLGDVLYEPQLTPARQIPNNPSARGFSSTPTPLPWGMIKDKENCTLTVKVPKVHLSGSSREEITSRRALWGTDIYTDDSDVIAACIHGGWIRGEWGEDIDPDMLDLDRGLQAPEKEVPASRKRKEKGKEEKARMEANAATYLDKPPQTGPVSIPPDRDMHVTVLILPRLEKYGSTTRFGIQSREFGGRFQGRKSVHDGISFMIMAIRWVTNGAGTQDRLRGKGRRERMRKAMGEVNAASRGLNEAELEREKQRLDRIRDEIVSGSWWKKDQTREKGAAKEERAPSEGDKENRPLDDGQESSTNKAVLGDATADAGDKMVLDDKPTHAEASSS
ncbi:hypothetical protein C8035_v003361 [Colletotrichum spinosum]|uniref:Histone deacetylation protein Rxt3 n=1 Tax=Colletotrichum spinosum TaxID=1347390 RepID=A0A4R8QK59_9PEZI|nr:hypothetical protein C8035_v003361 [Colletotrichum spinosum]